MQLLRQIRGDSWIEKKSGSKLPVCVEEQRWKCPMCGQIVRFIRGSHCFVLFGSLFFPSTDQHLVESDLNLGQLVTVLTLL
ncbi:hypothetical protein BRADI_1g40178v3 [Brachypodium distachyon]|uniref:Uncharacterized protein n=1 Tax=Brachypodium distachyon TaxID=15368 RepID=A0A0Q3H5U7_BRADI|nr:hypothetical protein BRADI_1g40178v3 [Brachypodium distachyon]